MVQFRGYFFEWADSKKIQNFDWKTTKMAVIKNDRHSTEITISIISDISVMN